MPISEIRPPISNGEQVFPSPAHALIPSNMCELLTRLHRGRSPCAAFFGSHCKPEVSIRGSDFGSFATSGRSE